MIPDRIAMLGDDKPTMLALRNCLLAAGYISQHYESAVQFFHAVSITNFDAFILGYTVQDLTGSEALVRIRQELHLTLPVIVVAPGTGEEYIANVLRGGADDCIATPTGDREFLARLEAVTRRWADPPPSRRAFQAGQLTVNLESRQIFFDGCPAQINSKNYELAVLLLSNIGRFISRAEIARTVWACELVGTRTLDVHISQLRTKLQLTEFHGWRLRTVYGAGYRLERLHQG